MDLGTALAIVSLGLTVCEGITKYCGAFKDLKSEVASLLQISSELHGILHSIEIWLQSRPSLSPAMVGKVEGSVRTCLSHLDEILDLCSKYSRPSTKDIKSRLLHAKRGLEFPFKVGTVQRLKSRMEALKTNINLSLALLTSDLTIEGVEGLKSALQQTEQTISSHMDQAKTSLSTEIAQLQQNMHDGIANSGAGISSEITLLESSISSQSKQGTATVTDTMDLHFKSLAQSSSTKMDDLSVAIADTAQQLVASTSSGTKHVERVVQGAQNELAQMFKHGQQEMLHQVKRLIQIERRYTTSQSTTDHHALVGPPQLKSRRRTRNRQAHIEFRGTIHEMCTCNPRSMESRYRPRLWSWFQVTSDTSLVHEKSCPIWYTSRRTITSRVNIRLWNIQIVGSLDFSGGYYSWRDWGMTPSPGLRCRTVVPKNTGAFAILNVLKKQLFTIEWEEPAKDQELLEQLAFDECLVCLQKEFSLGKASPHDVDQYGHNILTAISRIWSLGYIPREAKMRRQALELFQIIQSRWDIDPFEEDGQPLAHFPSAADALLSHVCTGINADFDILFEAIEWLSTRGLDLHLSISRYQVPIANFEHEYGTIKLGGLFNRLRHLPSTLFPLRNLEFIDAAGCNDLAITVLKRDQERLKTLLHDQPQLLSEENGFGQNALHFATEWTGGLKFILASPWITDSVLNKWDIFDADRSRGSPLGYAIEQRNTASISALLEAGATFELTMIEGSSPECSKLLIGELIKRRQDLQALAGGHDFGPCLSDDAARKYLSFLDEQNIHVRDAVRQVVLPKGSIYHRWYPGSSLQLGFFSRGVVQTLLGSGFVSVDEEVDGVTPLMTVPVYNNIEDQILTTELLLAHGADATKEMPPLLVTESRSGNEGKYSVLHFLALHFGHGANHKRVRWEEKWKLVWDFEPLGKTVHRKEAIFGSPLNDACCCGCSNDGCTPAGAFLKGIFEDTFELIFKGEFYTSTLLYLVEELFQLGLQRDIMMRVAMVSLRMMTFEALELTHTCCSLRWSRQYEYPGRIIALKQQEEVRRIREEESADLHLLESLVEEFTAKFASLALPLGDFLRGYWRQRMEEILYGEDLIPKEELQGQRELGVHLKVVRDRKDDFFSGLWR
ncbi:hypothetical protein QBC44DRAFT_85771 [Cladorrhinum sp. PSN332]|nr:hypothetical protein QBC44DRAFT_85771 [Cladorrhinum sp. PSN332]